jgi:hypothetical protein
MTDPEWRLESAELAYGIIARYVAHTQISGLVIAYLANELGEEKLKPLVQNEHWQVYQQSRRELIAAREDITRLTTLIEQMRAEQGEPNV